MSARFPWWVGVGLPILGMTISIASYSAIFYADAKTVTAYAKPNGKTITSITRQLSQVNHKISLSQSEISQLALQYQSLLGTARQDEAIISQVNNQLTASGLPIVPNIPTSFPIVNGYASNSAPPVFQTMTSAS